MPSNVDVLKSLMPDEVDLVEVVNSDVPVGPFGGAPTDLVAPDVEVRFIGPYETTPTEGLAYEGTEGLVAGWREWLLPYHSYRISPEEFLDAGEQVVMHARVSARTERDGVAIVHRPSSVWTF